MIGLYYIILFGVALFLMLFIFMYLTYKHFVQKIEQQKRENIKSVLEVQERERRIIALEVHDNLGPLLSITNMQLEALMIAEGNEQVKDELQDVYKQLKRAVAICRDISHELTPYLNNKIGLKQMISEYVEKINITGKIKASINCEIGDIIIAQQNAASICRIVLELLTNTVKHAEAKHAHIKIEVKGVHLALFYTDDGKGLQTKSNHGIGIKNIESRVQLLNGQLQIGQPGAQGIDVKIKIPVKELKSS